MNNRRDLLKALTLLPLAACTRTINNDMIMDHQELGPTPAGWLPDGKELNLQKVKIKKVKAIITAPYGIELVIVKVETDQPGLHGVGCATFRQRAHAVVTAINEYLDDFCRDKDVSNIEDLWQTAYVSSYWRNGPVLNNALSGLNQALWDIKPRKQLWRMWPNTGRGDSGTFGFNWGDMEPPICPQNRITSNSVSVNPTIIPWMPRPIKGEW
jgi:mannonate dehydratase